MCFNLVIGKAIGPKEEENNLLKLERNIQKVPYTVKFHVAKQFSEKCTILADAPLRKFCLAKMQLNSLFYG